MNLVRAGGISPTDAYFEERNMIFTNAKIFTPGGWVQGSFRTENGMVVSVRLEAGEDGTDLDGAKVIPGLVDIHIHGAAGADASDGDEAGLLAMSRHLARHGVTAFLPTLMALPERQAEQALSAVRAAMSRAEEDCARILGARTEGPYLSEKHRGAQNRAYLRRPDPEEFGRLFEGCGGEVRITDLAPELPGAAAFLQRTVPLCRVSLGHTAADYETAAAAFDAGAGHVTHLFNAMPPFHHRSPGIIGAAAERPAVTAEIICDGVHVHPSAVRAAFRLFPERLCLVSDAMRCCGLGEGEYELGGQAVRVCAGEARLGDGTLAGSVSNLFNDMKNAVRFGVAEDTAIRAATELPARVAGAEGRAGTIEPGRCADFLICGDDLSLREVYLAGRRIV